MITITIACEQWEIDIQANGKQRIEETIHILQDTGNMQRMENYLIYNDRNKESVNPLMTFQQARILNGDRLILIS